MSLKIERGYHVKKILTRMGCHITLQAWATVVPTTFYVRDSIWAISSFIVLYDSTEVFLCVCAHAFYFGIKCFKPIPLVQPSLLLAGRLSHLGKIPEAQERMEWVLARSVDNGECTKKDISNGE